MYKTWKHLIINDESELNLPKRLKNLRKTSSTGSWVAVIGFSMGGICSVVFTAIVGYTTLIVHFEPFGVIGVLMCAALTVVFFVCAYLFFKNNQINPFALYIQNPEQFIIIKGELTKASYISTGSKASRRMSVEGTATTQDGKRIHAYEFFHPDIWNFANQEEDKDLKPGDDWYSEKGKRPKLPIAAYFIYKKNDPSIATLFAVPKNSVL